MAIFGFPTAFFAETGEEENVEMRDKRSLLGAFESCTIMGDGIVGFATG